MPSLGNALQELREDRSATQLRLEKLNQAISAIESLNGTGTAGETSQPKRIISAASRRKMGAGAEGALGEPAEAVAASSGGSENNTCGSCKTHHITSRQKTDRGGTKGTVGEVEGGEEEVGCQRSLSRVR
jgi:hypothetical protein